MNGQKYDGFEEGEHWDRVTLSPPLLFVLSIEYLSWLLKKSTTMPALNGQKLDYVT